MAAWFAAAVLCLGMGADARQSDSQVTEAPSARQAPVLVMQWSDPRQERVAQLRFSADFKDSSAFDEGVWLRGEGVVHGFNGEPICKHVSMDFKIRAGATPGSVAEVGGTTFVYLGGKQPTRLAQITTSPTDKRQSALVVDFRTGFIMTGELNDAWSARVPRDKTLAVLLHLASQVGPIGGEDS